MTETLTEEQEMMTESLSEEQEKAIENWQKMDAFSEIIAKPGRELAYNNYLKGDVHKRFITAKNYIEYCREEINLIKRGKPSPKARFFCCESCFIDLFTCDPCYTYSKFTCNTFPDDVAWYDMEVKDMPTDDHEKLGQYLVENGFELETMTECVGEDFMTRKQYLAVFQELLKSAAQLALTLKGETAVEELLEALRLTQHPEYHYESVCFANQYETFQMSAEEAKAAYASTTRGLNALWCAFTLAQLKHPPKSAPKRTSKRTPRKAH